MSTKQLFTNVAALCIGILMYCLPGQAQDFHFSQYYASPMNLNPALTGVIDGNVRFAANYRNQWYNLASYSTYAFSMDGNVSRRKLNDNLLGFGGAVYQDVEMRSGFSNTSVSAAAAFNVKLSTRPTQYLGVGIQAAMLRKQINLDGAMWGNLYEIGQNIDPITNEVYGNFKLDMAAGLSWFLAYRDEYYLFAGLSMYHINRPDYGITMEDKIYRKIMGHVSAEYSLQDNFGILGTIMYSHQGPSNELNFGAFARFNAPQYEYITIYAGPMYRMVSKFYDTALSSESLILAFRVEIYNVFLGFSYDITTSSLADVNNHNGGPELSVIIQLPIIPQKRSIIQCPRF